MYAWHKDSFLLWISTLGLCGIEYILNAYLNYRKFLLIAISVKDDGIFFGNFDVATCSQNRLITIFESNPTSSKITVDPVKTAISLRLVFLLSQKDGALTAQLGLLLAIY